MPNHNRCSGTPRGTFFRVTHVLPPRYKGMGRQRILSENAQTGPSTWPMKTLAILAVFAAIVMARSFLMPVFLAFLLSLTFSPVRRFLQRRGVPPYLTAGLLVTGLLVGVALMVLTLAGPVQNYAENSRRIAFEVSQKLRGISETLEKVSDAQEQVEEMADTGTPDEAEPERVVVEETDFLTRLAVNAPIVVAQSLFCLVLLFFLTGSGDMFYEKMVRASPTFSDKKRAIGIAFDIERELSRYFLTITIINACLGIAVGLTLWLVGMPHPLLFGVGAFALNFIPYIGAVAGMAVTFAIGLISFDTLGHAVLAAGCYLFWTTLEGQFVTPYAVGRRLQLNPVIVFLAVAFWGWAWTFIGMFIAVPALIAVRVFSDHIPSLESLGIFLSGQDVRNTDKDETETADAEKSG